MDNEGCLGMNNREDSWISTYTGREFHVFKPVLEEIDINDIARALSMLCRFNGHVKKFYSVGQHSVLVSRLVNPEYALEGLLHDATEAYIGDLVRPLKIFMSEFVAAEKTLELAIAQKFNLNISEEVHLQIKKADNIALITEARDLVASKVIMSRFSPEIQPLKKKIRGLKPSDAEQKFLERYYELNGIRNGGRTQ